MSAGAHARKQDSASREGEASSPSPFEADPLGWPLSPRAAAGSRRTRPLESGPSETLADGLNIELGQVQVHGLVRSFRRVGRTLASFASSLMPIVVVAAAAAGVVFIRS